MNGHSRGGKPQKFQDTQYDGAESSLDNSSNGAINLYNLLRAPCLSLLQIYLHAFCGKQSVRTAMQTFRTRHNYIVRIMYSIDQIFDFGLIAIILFVFLRGLGIVRI